MADQETRGIFPEMNRPVNSGLNQYGSSIVLMTNPENELSKMEMTFRSIRRDKDGNLIQIGEPLMNEFGVNSVLGTIQSIVNQVTIMSNLNKFEVPMMMDFLGDTLAKDLMINRSKYGIINAAARDKIFFTTLTSCFITLKRAYEEGDKRFWKGSVQEIHNTVESTNKKKGFFSSINPWDR